MEPVAKLIASIAVLIGAIAWPAVFLTVFVLFREPIRSALNKVPFLLDRIHKFKIGSLETELENIADKSAAQAVEKGGRVTIDEIRSSAKIGAHAEEFGHSELLRELDKLCIEYDIIRRTMPAGSRRTRGMTKILVQMRALGPSLSDHIEIFKSSGSAGSRLAAIAIMQMLPAKADLEWLIRRFEVEQPFVFYHAALALQNASNEADQATLSLVQKSANKALDILKSFNGEPDKSSVEVLTAIVTDSFSGHYS